jgi:periplasmic divalent cation tolerance protein
MTEALIVFCSCADEKEAERIAHAAVEGRLAACATITGRVRSVYRWQGAIETAQEVLLLLKTTAGRLPQLEALIASLHSYDTPEILAVAVAEGSEKYLAWVAESVEEKTH